MLAKSGTPLFVSAQPQSLTDEMKEQLKKAYAINSVQKDIAEPVDWQYNKIPSVWMINGERVEYDWVLDTYPAIYHSMFNFFYK